MVPKNGFIVTGLLKNPTKTQNHKNNQKKENREELELRRRANPGCFQRALSLHQRPKSLAKKKKILIMVIASLLYFYPISSWLTTFSQRIYHFCFRPPIYAVRKNSNYYNQINPHPIYISQAEFLQEFKFPQEFRQDHTVPYHVPQFQRANGQLATHVPTSTSLQSLH